MNINAVSFIVHVPPKVYIDDRLEIKSATFNLFWRSSSAWLSKVVVSVNGDERPCDVGGSRVSEHLTQADRCRRRGCRQSPIRRTTGWFGSTRSQPPQTVQIGRKLRHRQRLHRLTWLCRTALKRCYEVPDLLTIPAPHNRHHHHHHHHHQ